MLMMSEMRMGVRSPCVSWGGLIYICGVEDLCSRDPERSGWAERNFSNPVSD